MKRFAPKNQAPVTIKTIIGAIIILIVVLTLFMLREIFPNNPFIMKYFNKGYLLIELLILIGIGWGIETWMDRRRKQAREKLGR